MSNILKTLINNKIELESIKLELSKKIEVLNKEIEKINDAITHIDVQKLIVDNNNTIRRMQNERNATELRLRLLE